MTGVHLVRHGRTASNRERRTMGWLEEGIEPMGAGRRGGRRRPGSGAGRLAGVEPARSCRADGGAAGGAARRQPILDDRFGELRVGPWEGSTEDEIAERWPEHWQRWRSEPYALEVE